jgi:hypothetical protein
MPHLTKITRSRQLDQDRSNAAAGKPAVSYARPDSDLHNQSLYKMFFRDPNLLGYGGYLEQTVNLK